MDREVREVKTLKVKPKARRSRTLKRDGIGRRKKSTSPMKECDRLFSLIVRSRGACEAKGKDPHRCGGPLQTAHIEGRRKMLLRWDERNVLCLCAGHHRYYSDYPIAWSHFIQFHFPDQYAHIIRERNNIYKPDYPALLTVLRERARELGVA